jgi:hypothetical protein
LQCRPLADSKDDKLRGLYRRNANQADQPAIIEIVLSHRCAIALHEKRLLGLASQAEPERHSFRRNISIACRTLDHSASRSLQETTLFVP